MDWNAPIAEDDPFARLVNISNDANTAVKYYARLGDSGGFPMSLAEFLMVLAHYCQNLYQSSGEVGYLNKAVRFIAAARNATGSTDSVSPVANLGRIYDLEGHTFYRRYECLGDVDDIEKALGAWSLALDHIPGDSCKAKAGVLSNLASSLKRRFEKSREIGDMNNAILKYEEAIRFASEGDTTNKPSLLYNLGMSLRTRFGQLGEIADINNSILILQQALDLTPDGHPDKPSSLHGLGNAFLTRFERLGDTKDVNNAVLRHQQAVNLTPEGHVDEPSWLKGLGSSLESRFEQLGDLHDINTAMAMHQKAADLTPDGHADKASRLSHLGNALRRRYEVLGDIEDITNAVLTHHEVIQLVPQGHPDRPSWLYNLGVSLRARFERLGNLADIDNAILRHQEAIGLVPDGQVDKLSWLYELGNALGSRFSRLGDIADINNAIAILQEGVDLMPDRHASKPTLLNNLGGFLLRRFERLGEISDINNSILLLEQAVDLTPDGHAFKPSRLNSLGCSLFRRFERQQAMSDLDDAILKQQKAVDLTPDGYADKRFCLNNLGASLQRRFEKSGHMADLNNAILREQQAIDLTPEGHADKPSGLKNLAISLEQRYQRLKHTHDYTRLILSVREAALSSYGPPLTRFLAALKWAKLRHPEIKPYRAVIALIPQIVWVGRSVEQRFKDLRALGDAVMEAVSAACSHKMYELALEWMEQGRTIVWGQILQLRSPMDELQAAHPNLANEVNRVATALEVAGTETNIYNLRNLSPEQGAQEHRRLAEKWDELIAKVRALPDFADFLKPKSALELKKASVNGTIVVVNVSRYRSDALVLLPNTPSIGHVQLSTLSLEKVTAAREKLLQSLTDSGVRVRDTDRGSVQSEIQGAVPNTLKMLWKDVAKPILEHLGYITPPSPGNLPCITWCLTGALGILPLHAAGLYNSPFRHDKLFNYVASSYTPSLTSLIEPLRQISAVPGNRSVLAITQQATPNHSPLPGTILEVDQVKAQMDKYHIPLMRMDGPRATVKDVLEEMGKHSWIHLSCHGKQDAIEPIKSAFLLHDGALELGEIMKKPLRHAELAYLSACQTASGDVKLPDEAMHLAAGMFIAGYRSVVGTLWSIKDHDAPLVAAAFYENLLDNPERGAARALHEAVTALRENVGENNLLSWVPYIHIGHCSI